MCKLKKFLSSIVIVLNCVIVIEVAYYGWIIAENRDKFTDTDFLVTLFMNFSMLFFVFVVTIGVTQSNLALLGTWIVYAIIELLRTTIIVFESWATPENEVHERIFNSCDLGIQTLSICAAFGLFHVIKLEHTSNSKISTTSRNLELNKINNKVFVIN